MTTDEPGGFTRCTFCGDRAASSTVRVLAPGAGISLYFCTLCDYERNGVGFDRFHRDTDEHSLLYLFELVRTARYRLLPELISERQHQL